MRMRLWMSAANVTAVACAAAIGGGATAGVSSFSFGSTTSGSHGTLGQYSGSMSWSHVSGNTATLTVSLTNLASTAAGGKLTGFVFGTPSVAGLTYKLTTVPANNSAWKIAVGRGAAAQPFGNYQMGAALGGDWNGGGSPNAGIGVGQTGTWVFTITGGESTLATLAASNFWHATNEFGFVARFKGFNDGGSDKTPGQISPPEELTVVPVPAPVLFAGVGLIAGVVVRRRLAKV